MRSRRRKWHLYEMFKKINGEMHCLWQALDHAGEVSESSVTRTCEKRGRLAGRTARSLCSSMDSVTVLDGIGSRQSANPLRSPARSLGRYDPATLWGLR